VYPVHFPARRCVADGALLVGDAARVSEPITGEGIYFAMRSGLLAAETIDLAFRRKNLAAPGLAGYEHACRRAFRPRLALNALMRFAVYRPALIDPFIRVSAKNGGLLNSLVDAVSCRSGALTCATRHPHTITGCHCARTE
jgi:flavin-dependent dehydrogenase